MNERIICEVCGFACTPAQLKKRWDGIWVCEEDYEARHPSDFIRVPKEAPPPAWTRPEPEWVFVDVTFTLP